MAVAFDAKQTTPTDSTSNSSPLTITSPITVGSGSNRALVVEISTDGATPSFSSVAWAGQSMTSIPNTHITASGVGDIFLYGLLAPTSGANNLVLTFTGIASTDLLHVYCVSFTGVNQSSISAAFPNGTTNSSGGGTSTPSTVTITTGGTNDIALAFHVNDTTGTFSSVNNTNLYIDNFGSHQNTASNYGTGASSVTLTGTMSVASTWGVSGTDISAAAVAGNVPYQPYFQQMLASKRKEAVGWREGYDHRWRKWRRTRNLFVPDKRIIKVAA